MKGVSSETVSRLTGFKALVVEVLECGQSTFTIARLNIEKRNVLAVVCSDSEMVTLFYDTTSKVVSDAIKIGWHARNREPEQLTMHI